MKKLIGTLTLTVLSLSFGATISRADEPVIPSDARFAEVHSGPVSFSDHTLAPDVSASHEITTREIFSNQDREFSGHYDWFNHIHRGSVHTSTAVPEPSALLMLLCGCLGLTAISRKLASSKA